MHMNSRAKTLPSAQAYDLQRLRRELEIVTALQASVGSINPRRPGLMSSLEVLPVPPCPMRCLALGSSGNRLVPLQQLAADPP